MDPETAGALLTLGKLTLILGAGCTAVMATLYAIGAAAVHYFQRKDRRNELMPLYDEGTIAAKADYSQRTHNSKA